MTQQLVKTARLWLLSLVCASVGATTIWATNSLAIGVLAFLASLVVLGPILWVYERRRPGPNSNKAPTPPTRTLPKSPSAPRKPGSSR